MHKPAKVLTQSAMMLALAMLLSLFAVFHLPNGGAVTLGSMIPLLFVAFKFDWPWSLLVAFAYSLLQMMSGFYAPPTQDLPSFAAVILLDYILAFSVIGLGGILYKKLEKTMKENSAMLIAGLVTFAARFFCHFLSGILIWSVYAPEGQPIWLYSAVYNGSYMGMEALISGIFLWFAGPRLLQRFKEM